MSAAAPAVAPGSGQQPGGAVMLFGRRISYDSLIVAGATVLGIIVLWQFNKAGSANLQLGATPNVGADTSQAAGNPSLPTSSTTISTSTTTDPSTPGTVLGAGSVSSATVAVPPATTNASPAQRVNTPPPAPQPSPLSSIAQAAPIGGANSSTVPRNIGPWSSAPQPTPAQVAATAALAPVGKPNASTVGRNIGSWSPPPPPQTVTPNAPPAYRAPTPGRSGPQLG